VPSLYCRLCRVKTRMVVGKFRFSIRVSAVTTLITHKVCSASRLAADITFFTSHVDPFKVVRLSEFKSKKSMTMRENSARTCVCVRKGVACVWGSGCVCKCVCMERA
jgi:hypothetical protein